MGWLGSNLINPAATGALALSGTSNETISLPGTGYNTLSLGAIPGGATYSGVLTPSGTTYYLGGGGGPLTYTPAITGNYGLAVGSVGTVILTTSALYTGATTIASGGTLQFSNAGNQTFGSNISGGGGLLMAGAARWSSPPATPPAVSRTSIPARCNSATARQQRLRAGNITDNAALLFANPLPRPTAARSPATAASR